MVAENPGFRWIIAGMQQIHPHKSWTQQMAKLKSSSPKAPREFQLIALVRLLAISSL